MLEDFIKITHRNINDSDYLNARKQMDGQLFKLHNTFRLYLLEDNFNFTKIISDIFVVSYPRVINYYVLLLTIKALFLLYNL